MTKLKAGKSAIIWANILSRTPFDETPLAGGMHLNDGENQTPYISFDSLLKSGLVVPAMFPLEVALGCRASAIIYRKIRVYGDYQWIIAINASARPLTLQPNPIPNDNDTFENIVLPGSPSI